MLRFLLSAWMVAGLAGCAAAPPAAVAGVPAPAAPARPDQGVVVARHSVPGDDPTPIRRLLDRLGAPVEARGATEFIVRADDGATLSVVSQGLPALLVGERVSIVRGNPTRLMAAEHVVAAR